MRGRGLTLVETVTATALLAAMTAAVVPIIIEARLRLEQVPASDGYFELTLLADVALRDPESIGVDPDWVDRVRAGPVTLQPLDEEPVQVEISRVGIDYVWVSFLRDGHAVGRWLAEDDP